MLRGVLRFAVDGVPITITGGPFDAMPEGARGLCLEAHAARVAEATWRVDVPDFGLPDEAALRAALTDMLAALRAAPDGAYHIGCKAGLGRTGTAWLRAGYNQAAIETPAQEDFVRRFARHPTAA